MRMWIRRRCALVSACLLFLQGGVIAQERPIAASTLTTTNTGTSSICVGCAVGTTTPAGTVLTLKVQSNDSITSGSSSNAGAIIVNGPAASTRLFAFRTAGVLRWTMNANNTAESGANAGSDFRLDSYSDAAALIGSALSITRSSMAATFGGVLTVTGGLSGNASTKHWSIGSNGDWLFGANAHIADSNGTPTITSGFGTSPILTGADYAFTLTLGSGAGNVGGVVTFAHTFTSAAVCVIAHSSMASADPFNVSTTTTSVTISYQSGTYTNATVQVLCRGY